jgi:hypothetical protein
LLESLVRTLCDSWTSEDARGMLFEHICHINFKKKVKHSLGIISLNDGRKETIEFQVEDVVHFDALPSSLKPGIYYYPKFRSLCAVDSFFFRSDGILLLFQITIAEKHPLKEIGLNAIQRLVPDNTNFQVIFILPEECGKFTSFNVQPILGAKKKSLSNSPWNDWQYKSSLSLVKLMSK